MILPSLPLAQIISARSSPRILGLGGHAPFPIRFVIPGGPFCTESLKWQKLQARREPFPAGSPRNLPEKSVFRRIVSPPRVLACRLHNSFPPVTAFPIQEAC
ncbi:MAG: hypothetical protein N3E46_12590 [Gemmataceae bacterium]|nr:hypothetical protein [Gemmataceae bacterium]